jgi:hypothetical protein
MIFDTQIRGIPCQCEVINYSAGRPMKIYGTGFGDAHPPEPPEFKFNILDRKGYKANWLQAKMAQDDAHRLQEEYEAAALAEKYGKDF